VTRTDLSQLLHARTIAVVGASETPDSPGRIIFELLRRSGCTLVPINLRRQTVFGETAYPSIEKVPRSVAIDLAVVTIPATAAVQAAEGCGRRGVPFVIVVAGGFGESGPEGRALEEQLKTLPRRFGTRILGPNSLGIFVPESRIDTIFVEHGDRALAGGGGVAFVTQSGSVGVESLGLASNTGFGMRAFVGLGNKCDLTELDFLRHFGRDPKSTCLAFYIESLDGGRDFLEEAKTVSRDKPVIVLKAGRTSSGAQAVSSHTGRLAGSDRVIGGAFRQFGIQRALDDEELCDAAKTLAALPPPAGRRVAVVTAAGGYGVMCTDYIESPSRRACLEMARLQSETQERIKAASFPFAACNNPVDLTASATDTMFGEAVDALLADPGVDIVICIAFFAPPAVSDALVEVIAERARRAAKPILAFTQYGPFTDQHLRRFYRAGVVGFPSVFRTVRAARFLAERAEIVGAFAGGTLGCREIGP
jgi:acyl-CoA synthetase (NDP forming)